MTITVLPQLVEAEALLSAQEAALMQQLAKIKEQRKGLQTVIAMFDASAKNNGPAVVVEAPIVEDSETPTESRADDTDVEAETVKDTVAAKLAKVTKAKKVSTSTEAKKTDGRTARWQRYMLDDYRQQRLPDIVADFLKAKPEDSFKIADVMSAIFEDNMPQAQFLKARNRVSNILSAGARDKTWYRGRSGTYSMSKKAVKAG